MICDLLRVVLANTNMMITIPDICHKYHKWDMWRKICHWEKFQFYIHDKCGEILNLFTSVMWRYFRFLHMTDVGNSEITPHVEKFQISSEHWCFCDLRYFVAHLFCRDLRVEKKFAQNFICGEKMTNVRYDDYVILQNEKYEHYKEHHMIIWSYDRKRLAWWNYLMVVWYDYHDMMIRWWWPSCGRLRVTAWEMSKRLLGLI